MLSSYTICAETNSTNNFVHMLSNNWAAISYVNNCIVILCLHPSRYYLTLSASHWWSSVVILQGFTWRQTINYCILVEWLRVNAENDCTLECASFSVCLWQRTPMLVTGCLSLFILYKTVALFAFLPFQWPDDVSPSVIQTCSTRVRTWTRVWIQIQFWQTRTLTGLASWRLGLACQGLGLRLGRLENQVLCQVHTQTSDGNGWQYDSPSYWISLSGTGKEYR